MEHEIATHPIPKVSDKYDTFANYVLAQDFGDGVYTRGGNYTGEILILHKDFTYLGRNARTKQGILAAITRIKNEARIERLKAVSNAETVTMPISDVEKGNYISYCDKEIHAYGGYDAKSRSYGYFSRNGKKIFNPDFKVLSRRDRDSKGREVFIPTF